MNYKTQRNSFSEITYNEDKNDVMNFFKIFLHFIILLDLTI